MLMHLNLQFADHKTTQVFLMMGASAMYIEGEVIDKVTEHTSMTNDKGSTNRRSFPSRMFFSCVHLTQLRASWCV